MSKKPTKLELPSSPDFDSAVDYLAALSDANNRLQDLEAEVNSEVLAVLEERKKKYAELQTIVSRCELELEKLVLRNRGWFSEDRRSIKTPFGTLKLHKSTKLEVKNDEVSILLIEQAIARAQQDQSDALNSLLRTVKVLNLEALEKLDDKALAQFRITRVERDNFSVVPAKVDMGKAVADAADKDQKAA